MTIATKTDRKDIYAFTESAFEPDSDVVEDAPVFPVDVG
jgi:hypothetical protein